MWIPIIVAILMGFVTPTTNTANFNNGTIYLSNNEPNDYSEDPDDDEEEEELGTDGPGGTGTGGGTGNNPPPKP